MARSEAGLYIAQDEGLFAAEGLNVKIDSIVSSSDARNTTTYTAWIPNPRWISLTARATPPK